MHAQWIGLVVVSESCAAVGRAEPDEGVGYPHELLESGARLHGASDPDFHIIVVLCDSN